jgi:hypothetical protein
LSLADLLATSSGPGYKTTPTIANFAASLVTPDEVNYDDVSVMHGAKFMQPWPMPTDNRTELPAWWPTIKANPASIQLIITDWNEGDLDAMVSARASCASSLHPLAVLNVCALLIDSVCDRKSDRVSDLATDFECTHITCNLQRLLSPCSASARTLRQ